METSRESVLLGKRGVVSWLAKEVLPRKATHRPEQCWIATRTPRLVINNRCLLDLWPLLLLSGLSSVTIGVDACTDLLCLVEVVASCRRQTCFSRRFGARRMVVARFMQGPHQLHRLRLEGCHAQRLSEMPS